MLNNSFAEIGAVRTVQRGVTLMELLTVVVVLGVLASIAVPSYRSYLIRSQRSDAKTALLQLQVAQEKFYLQNNAYTNELTTAPPGGLGMTGTSDHGYYALEVTLGPNGQSYTATATPVTGKGQDDDSKCTSLTLTEAGARGATGTGGTEVCWR